MRHPESEGEDVGSMVRRCLAGDDSAWGEMFRRCQPALLSYARFLTQGEGGRERAEEVAAAVWCSLCADGYARLRRYDPAAGDFALYLRLLARGEAWRRRRADRSRQAHETNAARSESTAAECGRGLEIQEFLETLTPREREFCLAHLLSEDAQGGAAEFSEANAWQLRSRILKKFRLFYT